MNLYTNIALLILLGIKCMAQQGRTPSSMHVFLQKTADSTIIYSSPSSFLEPPKYAIISKKGDTISIYSYGSAFSKNKYSELPTGIRDTLKKIYLSKDINSFKVGINEFFDVRKIKMEDAKTFWRSLMNLVPWQIKDDAHNGGGGCPPNVRADYKNYSSDNGGIGIDLITKAEIKYLYFDNPWYYERKEVCPGNKNRQAALKIEELFKDYFKK